MARAVRALRPEHTQPRPQIWVWGVDPVSVGSWEAGVPDAGCQPRLRPLTRWPRSPWQAPDTPQPLLLPNLLIPGSRLGPPPRPISAQVDTLILCNCRIPPRNSLNLDPLGTEANGSNPSGALGTPPRAAGSRERRKGPPGGALGLRRREDSDVGGGWAHETPGPGNPKLRPPPPALRGSLPAESSCAHARDPGGLQPGPLPAPKSRLAVHPQGFATTCSGIIENTCWQSTSPDLDGKHGWGEGTRNLNAKEVPWGCCAC